MFAALSEARAASAVRRRRHTLLDRDSTRVRWWRDGALVGIGHKPPPLHLRHSGLLAAFVDDDALSGFLDDLDDDDPLRHGFQMRLRPTHSYGSWSALPELSECRDDMSDADPVAVLTLGRIKGRSALRFAHATAKAEAPLLDSPGLLLSTGIVHLPFLATVSLWASKADMRAYSRGAGHGYASRTHHRAPLHQEAAFVRCEPYARSRLWDGRVHHAGS